MRPLKSQIVGNPGLERQRLWRRWAMLALVAVCCAWNVAGAASNYLSPPWRATTFAGYLGVGSNDGPAATATFNEPSGLALGPDGTIHIADTFNSTVRVLTGSGASAEVDTVAGVPGVAGVSDGPAAGALFNLPFALVVASDGTRYVADTENHLIRRISPAGQVTTLAGLAAQAGSVDGVGAAARFRSPAGLALDPTAGASGVLYVADTGNHLLRRLDIATGAVTLLAGAAGTTGSTVNGSANVARFHGPVALALSADRASLYVADQGGHTIRHVVAATGAVTTLAGGAGTAGSADGSGTAARFDEPKGLALDGAGRLYVAEANGCRIRRIALSGALVETIAGEFRQAGSVDGVGTAARFSQPAGLAFDAANSRLLIADAFNAQIRALHTATLAVTTLAGPPPSRGATDGAGLAARFRGPVHLARDTAGNLYVADRENHTLRKIAPDGTVTTLAGLAGEADTVNGVGAAARFNHPVGVAVAPDGSVIYVSEEQGHVVRRVTSSGAVTTLAGQAYVPGFENGTGTAARFSSPAGLALDAAGNVFVADFGNNSIRRITPAGVVTNFAGASGASVGEAGSANGQGSSARFWGPYGIAIDAAGTAYVADSINQTIRKITSGGLVSTFAGAAQVVGSNDATSGASARFSYPYGVAVDASGRVFVADYGSHLIRRIEPSGAVATVIGTASAGGAVDGLANAARLRNPRGVAVSPDGQTLYVADTGNHTVRKVAPVEVPVITSPLTAGGTVGQALSPYQITASRSSYAFGAVGLPSGLGVNPQTGVITGTPLAAGVFSVTLQAENVGGVGSAVATFTIAKGSATVSLSALDQPFDGTPKLPVAATTPAGLPVVFRFNGSTTAPTQFGTYALTATIDHPNYTGEATATFRIGAPVFWSLATTFIIPALQRPSGLAIGPDGALYIADADNNVILRRTPAGVVNVFVTGLNEPAGLAFDTAGNLYVADAGNHVIRRVTSAGAMSTVAGLVGVSGTFNGTGTAARFFRPVALAFAPDGTLLVADSGNGQLRRITLPSGAVTGFATSAGTFDIPSGLAIAADGTIYLSAEGSHNLWRITPAGLATRIAGSGFGVPGSSDGTDSNALFDTPRALALGPDGNLYVTDTFNHTLRRVTPAGGVTTVAGLATEPGTTDGTGPSARLSGPSALMFTGTGSLYIADTDNGLVRLATPPLSPPVFNLPATLTLAEGTPPANVVLSATGSSNVYAATGLPSGLSLNTTTGALGGTPLASGIYAVTVSATNSLTTSQTAITFTVNAPSWETWRTKVFTDAQLANPAWSGPAADPDGDGVPNLLEYLRDRAPGVRDATPPALVNNPAGLGLVFEQLRALAGWRIVPEYSSDLATWRRGEAYVQTVSTTVLDARRQRVEVRLTPALASEPRKFLRLALEPIP